MMDEQSSTSPAADWEADPRGVAIMDEDGCAVGSRLRKPREYVNMAHVNAAIADARARCAEGWMVSVDHAVVPSEAGDGWVHTSWLGGLNLSRLSVSDSCEHCVIATFNALMKVLLHEPGELGDRYVAALARLEGEGK